MPTRRYLLPQDRGNTLPNLGGRFTQFDIDTEPNNGDTFLYNSATRRFASGRMLPDPNVLFNWVSPYLVGGSAAQAGTAARVNLTAMYTPQPFQPSRMSFIVTTQSAGTNARLGIYQYDGTELDPSSNATLLYDSGNISVATTGLKDHSISGTVTIQKGMFWTALETEDNTVAFRRLSNTVIVPSDEPLYGSYYTRAGGFGALTNPCPVVTADDTTNFITRMTIDEWAV